MSDCGVRVICRFRPVNKRELEEGSASDIVVGSTLTFPDTSTIQMQAWNGRSAQVFAFDRVFHQPTTTQEEVYELAARDSIDNLIRGFNATIFAYGMIHACDCTLTHSLTHSLLYKYYAIASASRPNWRWKELHHVWSGYLQTRR
jgi:hypothetical protein